MEKNFAENDAWVAGRWSTVVFDGKRAGTMPMNNYLHRIYNTYQKYRFDSGQ